MRHDLDARGLADQLLEALDAPYQRYVMRNGLVRLTALGTQLEIYRTTAGGSIEFIRSLLALDLTQTMEKRIDVLQRSHLRAIYGYPAGAANSLVYAVTRTLPAHAVTAREMFRFFWQTWLTPHRGSLTRQMMAFLHAEPATVPSLVYRTANWYHVARRRIGRVGDLGGRFLKPEHYHEIPRHASVGAVTLHYAEQRAALRKLRDSELDGPPCVDDPYVHKGSAKHTAWLLGYCAPGPRALGVRHGSVPVSMIPAIALGKDGRYPALARALLGLEALAMEPFAKVRARADADDAGPEPTGPARPAFSSRFRIGLCPACAAQPPMDQGVLSLRHLAHSCKHPLLAEWRARMVASIPALLDALVDEGQEALRRDPWAVEWAPAPGPQVAAVAALRSSVPELPLSHGNRVLTLRLLLAAPWPASAVTGEDQHGLAALGGLFDALNVKPHLLRRWAATWLDWAEGQLQTLGVAFKRAQLP